MSGLLLKLLVMSEALLVALPPGACCVNFKSAGQHAGPSRGSCCRPETPRPERSPVPPAPGASECCCRYDGVPRGEQVAVADGWALPVAAFPFDSRPRLEGVSGVPPAPESLDPGPPRHLLHCVWLC
ncbi:MAG: hypothetical protein WD069_22360 [Planctomycetales bacterium]